MLCQFVSALEPFPAEANQSCPLVSQILSATDNMVLCDGAELPDLILNRQSAIHDSVITFHNLVPLLPIIASVEPFVCLLMLGRVSKHHRHL